MPNSKSKGILNKLVDVFSLSTTMTYNNSPKKIDNLQLSWVKDYYLFIGKRYIRLTKKNGDDSYIMSKDFYDQLLLNNGTEEDDNDDSIWSGFSHSGHGLAQALEFEGKWLNTDHYVRFIYKEKWHVITALEAKKHGIVHDEFYIGAFKFGNDYYDSWDMTEEERIGTYDFFLHVKLAEDNKLINAK